jgi:hypothetical protein
MRRLTADSRGDGSGMASDDRDVGAKEERNKRNHETCGISGGTGAVSRSSSWRHGAIGWRWEEEYHEREREGWPCAQIERYRHTNINI